MAQLLKDALLLSPDLRLQGVVESAVLDHDLFKVLPFYRCTNALGMTYLRVKARPSTGFIPPGGDVVESAGSLEEVHARIRHIVGDVDVLGAADRLMGAKQRGTHIALKASATARLAADAIINGAYGTAAFTLAGVALASGGAAGPDGGTGPRMPLSGDVGPGSIECVVAGAVKTLHFKAPGDVNYGTASADLASGNPKGVVLRSGDRPNLWIRVDVTSASLPGSTTAAAVTCTTSSEEFDGLIRMVDPSQIIDPEGANGDNMTFSVIRKTIRKCKAPPGTRRFLVMDERDLEETCKLYDALGGASVQQMALPEYGIESIPVFAGKVPILVISDDVLAPTETVGTNHDGSRIFCLGIGLPTERGEEKDAPMQGPGLFGVYAGTAESMAEGRNCAGMFLEDLGSRAAKDLHGNRVGWDLGVVNYAAEGISCAWGLTPSAS
jgi:hypothetical protein